MPTRSELLNGTVSTQHAEDMPKTTFYMHNDQKIPLNVGHTVTGLVNNILTHNSKVNYTSVLVSGQSGSGKTTFVQTLIHRISCKNKNNERFIVKWFSGKDIHTLDDEVNKLQKGMKYVLVFDDVSFQMDMLSGKKKKEIASALTTIRHQVEGQVISFMIIHYQKGILPMMRDSNFRVITSMSDQDAINWKNTLGWNQRFKIDRYQKQYASQFQKGYFFINSVEGGNPYRYTTNEPFRIGLVSEMVGLHSLLMPKEGCNFCSPKNNRTIKDRIDAKVLYDKFKKTYRNRADPALQYFMYFQKGKTTALPSEKLRAVNFLTKLLEKYDVDYDELEAIAKGEHGKFKKRIYTKQDEVTELEKEIVKESNL